MREGYSPTETYPEITKTALLEMHRQVGVGKPAGDGLMYRGLMIRHPVMPNGVSGTKEAIQWIAGNLPKAPYLNLMSQSTPMYKAFEYPAIDTSRAEDKPAIPIGLAVIDRTRCLPWARAERCVICLEACPSNYNAIELRPTPTGPFHLYVKRSLCTGCGICEHQCPLEGDSAIRVEIPEGG